MKKHFLFFLTVVVFFAFPNFSSAQGMPALSEVEGMGSGTIVNDDHTAREEVEGREVWKRLQGKEIRCEELTVEDYEALGEYFMGRMMGSSHAFMNQMMTARLGEEGEEQMHEVMGRRMSGCDASAAFPSEGADFMPMMNMMLGMYGGQGAGMMGSGRPPFDQVQTKGGSGPWSGTNNNSFSMMGFGYPMGFGGGLFMVLWWVLVIVALVALVRWLVGQWKGGSEKSRALDILKERYAKGEITKEEFERMKRDII